MLACKAVTVRAMELYWAKVCVPRLQGERVGSTCGLGQAKAAAATDKSVSRDMHRRGHAEDAAGLRVLAGCEG